MKKILSLLVMLMACQLTFSQTPTDVINQFKDKEGVEYNELPKIMISLVAESMEDATTKEMMSRLNCMKMLSIAKVDAKVKARFLAEVKKLEKKYTKVTEMNEEGETILIFYEGDEENIQTMVMADAADDSCDLIVLEGKLKASDLTTFSNMQGD